MQQGRGYNDLQTREVPVPKPKANEVLVKVHAVSLQVSVGSKLAILSTADRGSHSIATSLSRRGLGTSGESLLLVLGPIAYDIRFDGIRVRENIVPCSDMAGEVISVGVDVKDWKAGDRVCSNFSTDHLAGPPTPETVATSLGGESDGVLVQYRTFPAHVSQAM